jgi:PPOX class probable F420-dependent enzyme
VPDLLYHPWMPNRDPAARPLPPAIRTFLLEPHLAVVASLDRDGAPRQAVVWHRLEDDGTIVINSREGRRWPANLRRDDRVAIAVMDEAAPTRWVGLTGRVEAIVDDQAVAQADIADLAHRYDSREDAESSIAEFRTQHRVTFRIRLLGVHDHL